MAKIWAQLAKAPEEAVQEYKANFKDTDAYLVLMRDVVAEYKEALKGVDPNFNGDHYDKLILGEPQTIASDNPVGFKQLAPIGTPGIATSPLVEPNAAPAETLAMAQQEALIQQPAEPTADQGIAPATSQPAAFAADQPTISPTTKS